MIASRLITTPFTAASTTADVLAGVDLAGLRAIVTGASSGLGRERRELSPPLERK